MLSSNVAVPIVYICSSIYLLVGCDHQIDIFWIVKVCISAQPLKCVHFCVKGWVLGANLNQLIIHVFIYKLLDNCSQRFKLILNSSELLTISTWISLRRRLLSLSKLAFHLLFKLIKQLISARLIRPHGIDISDHLLPHPTPVLLKPFLDILSQLCDLVFCRFSFSFNSAISSLSTRSFHHFDLIKHVCW